MEENKKRETEKEKRKKKSGYASLTLGSYCLHICYAFVFYSPLILWSGHCRSMEVMKNLNKPLEAAC